MAKPENQKWDTRLAHQIKTPALVGAGVEPCRSKQLEDNLQAELGFARRPKGVDTGAYADPVDQMSGVVGAVDASSATCQQP